MTATTAPGARLTEPLAVDATTAQRHTGPCALCRRLILRGSRYATLVTNGQPAHLTCIARSGARPSQRKDPL